MQEITINIPSTIANVGVGFDVLGLALNEPFDTMKVSLTDKAGIALINSTDTEMPLELNANCSSVAALAFLRAIGKESQGICIEFVKKVRPGSGLGSSASSSVGAVFALNELFGKPFTAMQLMPFAMMGEQVASNAWHADNVGPAMLGGFTLIRESEPLDIIQLAYPDDLHVVALHPHITIKTSESRQVVPKTIPTATVVKQTANIAAFVTGLSTSNYGLISRSMKEYIAEPHRASLIPGFVVLKQAVLKAGALGFGISGSGPTVFAFANKAQLNAVYTAMIETYTKQVNADFDIYKTSINKNGPEVVS